MESKAVFFFRGSTWGALFATPSTFVFPFAQVACLYQADFGNKKKGWLGGPKRLNYEGPNKGKDGRGI